jgi:hypothetical protein
MKTVIKHVHPGTPAEGISSNLKNSVFNVICLRQMTAPPSIPLQLNKRCKITRYSTCTALIMLSSRQRYELRLVLREATAANILAVSGSATSKPLDMYCAVVATCIEIALKRQLRNLRRVLQLHLIQRHTEAAAIGKEKSTASSQGILWDEVP